MKAPQPIAVMVQGYRMEFSAETVALAEGFEHRGHMEPVIPTEEEIAQHARAVELLEELESNPYIHIGGYDYELDVIPLRTERWVADETDEEWIARWRAQRAAKGEADA